jgi:biopolymer transport protein ExbB
MLASSIERLHEAFNGTKFEGTAVDTEGKVLPGSFVLAGPVAIFRSGDGTKIGTADQRLGSLEPNVTPYENPEVLKAAGEYIASGVGGMPFDPTLGQAHRIAETEETLWEHIKAGGPVMWPIGILAGAALLVALFKWVMMLFVRMPSERRVRELLRAVGAGDRAKATALVAKLPGPLGRMLETGVATMDSGRDVMEESMYEIMHKTQLKAQSLLPFVAISAAAAPLPARPRRCSRPQLPPRRPRAPRHEPAAPCTLRATAQAPRASSRRARAMTRRAARWSQPRGLTQRRRPAPPAAPCSMPRTPV